MIHRHLLATRAAALVLLSAIIAPASAEVPISLQEARGLEGAVCVPAGLKLSTTGESVALVSNRSVTVGGWGYRYNPLIVTTLAGARDALKRTLSYRSKTRASAVAQERLAWLDDESNVRELAETLPRFWRKWTVYFAPLFFDPFHACPGGSLTPVEDQYALFYWFSSPRVHGDLCAKVPRIIFDTSGKSFRNLELQDLYASRLGRHGSVELQSYLEERRGMLFDDVLRMIMGLHTVQCGYPPTQIELVWQKQERAPSAKDASFSLDNMKNQYQGVVSITDTAIALEPLEQSDFALKAKQAAREAIERRRTAWQEKARREDQAAIGMAILFALIIGAGVGETEINPCGLPQYDPRRPVWCP